MRPWLIILLTLSAALAPVVAMAQPRPADTQRADATSPASQPAGAQLPITFARSGGKAVVAIGPINLPSMELVLRTYGRVWMQRTAKNQKDGFHVEFDVPAVRVPTVFSVTHADLPAAELAQVVAYPDRDVPWEKKITLYSTAAPAWFSQWAAATGLPVKQIALADLESAKLMPDDEKSKSLLILSRPSAGKDLADVVKIAKDKSVNVLVLDAEWFGNSAGPVDVAPKHMYEGLSDIAKQSWPHPLKFASHRQPWPGIANRRAWIVGENGLPLAESVRSWFRLYPKNQAVLLSYVPWELRLGRDESADETLLALLSAAAQTSAPNVGGYHGVSVEGWPETIRGERPPFPKVSQRPFKPSLERPVLSAILDSDHGTDMGPAQLDVLDIRGKQPATQALKDAIENAPARGGMGRRVLILGDDEMLDDWKWLKLDREKKTIGRPDVVWLSDDELPPSKESQIRLMLKLTELGVPLAPPSPPASQLKGK